MNRRERKMQKSHLSSEEKNDLIDDIMKWLLFGVLLTISPPFFYYLYRIIVGFQINYRKIVPDVMLVILALSLSLLNMCIDYKKIMQRLVWWIGCCFFSLISVFCWGIYILHQFGIKADTKNDSLIFYISIAVTAIYVILGIGLKCFVFFAERKKHL